MSTLPCLRWNDQLFALTPSATTLIVLQLVQARSPQGSATGFGRVAAHHAPDSSLEPSSQEHSYDRFRTPPSHSALHGAQSPGAHRHSGAG